MGNIVQIAGVPCQLGGGIRDEPTIRLLLDQVGVDRVIIGTQALKHPEWFRAMAIRFPDRICLGLDARDSMVATEGWLEVSKTPALELARQFVGLDVAAVIYQHPNFFGLLESPQAIHSLAHEAGALAVAVCDPIALALLEPPGSTGADIVVGEGQSLGNPPSFGGPLLGFFACKQSLVRRMPGRIAAQTVDRHGRRGFVLTLQTREQHIRREKATSNICTNQGLLALRATIYLGLMGKRGLAEVAELCVQKTHHAATLAERVPGYRRAHEGPFFREFVLECPVDAAEVVRAGRARGILPGVDLGRFRPGWRRQLLVAVTEQRNASEIERWAEVLAAAGGRS